LLNGSGEDGLESNNEDNEGAITTGLRIHLRDFPTRVHEYVIPFVFWVTPALTHFPPFDVAAVGIAEKVIIKAMTGVRAPTNLFV